MKKINFLISIICIAFFSIVKTNAAFLNSNSSLCAEANVDTGKVQKKIINLTGAADNANGEQPLKRPQLTYNLITLDMGAMVRGYFGFDYERYLQPKLSIDIGIGLTYRDFEYELFHRTDDDLYSNINANMSFGGLIGIKFYPGGHDNFDGVFIKPEIGYRNYNLTTALTDLSNPNDLNNADVGYHILDINFKIGQQSEFFYTSNVFWEWHVGFGIRNVSSNDIENVTDPITSETHEQVVSVHKVYPAFLGGFGIGFSF